MDPEIKKLLNVANENDKLELTIFQNAVQKNLKNYHASPIKKNKQNLDAARDSLATKKEEMMKKYLKPEPKENTPGFPSLRSVLLHLDKAGFRISKSKLYRDRGKGMIRVNPDRSVLETEVRAYAATLERKDGSIADLNDIHNRKTGKEIDRLDEQIAKLRFEREKDEGKYVLKEDVDLKIISTLTILDVSFRQLMDMNMSDICHIFGGDVKKLNTAKDYVDQLLDEMMNKLARTDSFSIKIIED